MKTMEDLVKRHGERHDMLGFDAEAVGKFLDYDAALQCVRPDKQEDFKAKVSREEWAREEIKLTRENVIEVMREYMAEYGWDKAANHRGISANRTIIKMSAWLWILEDEDTLRELKDTPYAQYGAPKLALICKKYDFPIPGDSGIQSMIRGEPCRPGCDEGCDE